MKRLLILLLLTASVQLIAQDEKELLKELLEEDRTAAETVVLFPEETRGHIFEVSQHPELLLKLSSLQKKTKDEFRFIIKNYEKNYQEKFYELTRYRVLLNELGSEDRKSKKEIEDLLISYPEDIHETATELGRNQHETLRKIVQLNQSAKKGMQEVLSGYPEDTRASVKALITNPEVLTTLTENIEQTILVGDLYKKDPEWVNRKADSLNRLVVVQRMEELEDYKAQLESDSAAYQEMLDAAETYKRDNQIKDTEPKETKTTVHYSYSYWYGYPYWYPYWTPVPYYYHTGFYIGSGGTVVIIGLPSYHYVNWHYTYYPHAHIHLHAHYTRHYHRHPHSRGGFHSAVNVNVNRDVNINRTRNVNRSRDASRSRNINRDRSASSFKNGKPDFSIKDRSGDKSFQKFSNNDRLKGGWESKGSQRSGRSTSRKKS